MRQLLGVGGRVLPEVEDQLIAVYDVLFDAGATLRGYDRDILLGLAQCVDDVLGQGRSRFTRERARGATTADFGRGAPRGGCVVKDSYDRIVR